MRAIATRSPSNPEFARVVPVARLGRSREFTFDLSPDAAEAAALARLLDARAVRRTRFAGALRPEADGWALEARLGATVVQTCGVTLEPVTSRVDVPVRRRFLPMDDGPGELVIAPEEDDETEPLADRIDLGLVAIEALALALPAYPRSPAAEAGEAGFADPDAADDGKPFAALATLRDKLGGDR